LVLHPDGKWQRECQPGTYMSYLYGIRFMQVDETFTFHSRSQGIYNSAIVGATGDYDVVTHNDMLGFQVGAEMTFRRCRWSWGLTAKVGPYVNFASQSSTIDASVEGVSDSVNQQIDAAHCVAAVVCETGVETTYKFRPNLIGHASYDLMWVSGLALAPNQLQFVASPLDRVAASGTIFSQGVSLGLEWLW
jgi:hypothetical protein